MFFFGVFVFGSISMAQSQENIDTDTVCNRCINRSEREVDRDKLRW
jgi:hypothetical protein